MYLWLLIVVVAQFLNAIAATVDKFIVTSKTISKPIVYAFYVSALSIISLAVFLLGFLPLGGDFQFPKLSNIYEPSLGLLGLSLLSAYAFFFALWSMYSSLEKSDASDVIPMIGAVNAVITFIVSFIFLDEILNRNSVIGFVFLVLGMLVLSHFRFSFKNLITAFLSGLSFAIYYSSMKLMFQSDSFDQVFFWTRIATIVVVATVWIASAVRSHAIQNARNRKNTKAGYWVIGNNILGGTAGLLLLKSIELGNVALVQALNGLQFVFLIMLSALFGHLTPQAFGENNKFKDVYQKIISIILISVGFYFLFV